MAQKKFSELEAGTVDGTSIFAQTKTEDGSLVSKSASSTSLAGYIGTSHQFAGLSTTAKNLVGAINEVASKKLPATLTAGSTSLTFTDSAITETSLISVYTEGGLLYNSITTAVGSVVLTFDEQATDVAVTLIVR